jgi:hypothetical protein
MLIEVAISVYRNVIKKEPQKILKYKDTQRIQRMWKIKAKVIPGITWATETISKSSKKYQSNITEKRDIKELKKTIMLGAAQNVYHGK